MSIMRWDPFRDLVTLRERMERLFEDFLAPARREEEITAGVWTPAVDIYETPENFVLKAELPGLTQKDINLELKQNVLTLSGERRFEEEVKRESYHRVERAYGSFKRSFSLPGNVESEKVSAKFKDGVLEVVIPKREEAKPKRIEVKVE